MLLVDTSHTTTLLHRFHLTNLGCNVTTAENFAQAAEQLKTNYPFTVIFITVRYPYEAGLEFASYVRQNFPHLLLVVLGDTLNDSVPLNHAAAIGAEFLLSPVGKNAFQALLQRLQLL